MSKGQRIRLGSRSRRFRGFENRIAREHLAATTPPVRVRDPARTDEPADAVPAHVDRAEHTSVVLDVENIGVAVVQENPGFTFTPLLHEGEHLRQGGFSFRFAAEFGDDRTVHRGLPQLVIAERMFANRVFGLAVTVQEPRGEVVAEVADLDLGFAASVTNELLFGDKFAREGGNRRPDKFEELFGLCGNKGELATDELHHTPRKLPIVGKFCPLFSTHAYSTTRHHSLKHEAQVLTKF